MNELLFTLQRFILIQGSCIFNFFLPVYGSFIEGCCYAICILCIRCVCICI